LATPQSVPGQHHKGRAWRISSVPRSGHGAAVSIPVPRQTGAVPSLAANRCGGTEKINLPRLAEIIPPANTINRNKINWFGGDQGVPAFGAQWETAGPIGGRCPKGRFLRLLGWGSILQGGDSPEFVFADALEATLVAGARIEVLLRR